MVLPMEYMSQKESYTERRQLFKNIWDTAMQIDERDRVDVLNKPKVIKTLRLGEVDKCVIGKRKRERINNLRTVCNRILNFCDRQEEDDRFYEQMVKRQQLEKVDLKPRKLKSHVFKKKNKRTRNSLPPIKASSSVQMKASQEKHEDDINKTLMKFQTHKTSKPIPPLRTPIIGRLIDPNFKPTSSPANLGAENWPSSRHKVIKAKPVKTKQPKEYFDSSEILFPITKSLIFEDMEYFSR